MRRCGHRGEHSLVNVSCMWSSPRSNKNGLCETLSPASPPRKSGRFVPSNNLATLIISEVLPVSSCLVLTSPRWCIHRCLGCGSICWTACSTRAPPPRLATVIYLYTYIIYINIHTLIHIHIDNIYVHIYIHYYSPQMEGPLPFLSPPPRPLPPSPSLPLPLANRSKRPWSAPRPRRRSATSSSKRC
jgi:hypothetical protein